MGVAQGIGEVCSDACMCRATLKCVEEEDARASNRVRLVWNGGGGGQGMRHKGG